MFVAVVTVLVERAAEREIWICFVELFAVVLKAAVLKSLIAVPLIS
jgi:hypothetical protein